jgi:hypothetical protein
MKVVVIGFIAEPIILATDEDGSYVGSYFSDTLL